MDQARRDRVARNEAAFRELNEAISKGPPDRAEVLLVCECGHPDCSEQFVISLDFYRHVREDPRQFVLLAGHEIPDTEDVIEEQGRYVVVRKHEDVSDIVEHRDPPI